MMQMNMLSPFTQSLGSESMRSKLDKPFDKDYYEKRTKVEGILGRFKQIEKTLSLKKGRMD